MAKHKCKVQIANPLTGFVANRFVMFCCRIAAGKRCGIHPLEIFPHNHMARMVCWPFEPA